ncbi:hypothetical protein CT690_14715 [Serratia plymuthica]|uniref:OmpR/PhoB-type domain-containing protein n=1 Tax=Serratia plymuthica TaxID=82996 RepID=A0A318P0J0_SERPL|nr:hypothetical protein [Serratia plymuthica]PYD38135.1 hypothetical protein CT690_14715 [Serratia plymuthica]
MSGVLDVMKHENINEPSKMPNKSGSEGIVFGYLIAENVLFDIKKYNLININCKKIKSVSTFSGMRETMSRLLIYLLENSARENISIEDILFNVWDKYGLQSSTSRLWQVMQTLKINLSEIGVPQDFITQTTSNSYTVKTDLVRVLYCYEPRINNAASVRGTNVQSNKSHVSEHKNSHR